MSRPWFWPVKESEPIGPCPLPAAFVSPTAQSDLFDHSTRAMSKDPSASNTPAESSKPAPELSDADLERLLNREASAIQRELEVDRILNAFKLKSVSFSSTSWAPSRVLIFYCSVCSPYDILDLETTVTTEGVKKKYRQLSLCELPFSTRKVELCSLIRGFLYVFND